MFNDCPICNKHLSKTRDSIGSIILCNNSYPSHYRVLCVLNSNNNETIRTEIFIYNNYYIHRLFKETLIGSRIIDEEIIIEYILSFSQFNSFNKIQKLLLLK